jgi:hypothetical protein
MARISVRAISSVDLRVELYKQRIQPPREKRAHRR